MVLRWNSRHDVTLYPITPLIHPRLHEIVSVYQKLSPPNLSYDLSNRVCNVLGLLQALALH